MGSNTQFDIHSVLNANDEYEDLTEIVKDPSKIIIYDTWDQMLKDRDNLHTYYIRQNGDKEYEVMKYSKWSGDQYVGYVGPHGYSSLKELYNKNPGKYDTDDVCLVKEFHIEEKLSESKITERYSFPEVDDALNHFWNDLGKDPEVDDVIGFLEDEYPDWVPTNPEDYGRWYHDVAGEISARLSESKLTEAPMDVKDYAARLKARKAEKSQNPLEKINSQIDSDMSITDQLQVYFDELVPAQGKADTVAGELVRAMMRVLYRDYNDGDLFYSGYGKETCGGSVVYLMDKVEDLERPFSEIVENQYEDQYYTTELEDAADLLLQYLNNHPELFMQKNEEDSRNVDENRLDDYFSLPLYEFEPDTSYDESYYAVSDDDIDEFIRGVVSSDLSSGDVNRWARDGWTIVDLDKEDYDTLQELWDRWFRDFLVDYERQEEDEYEDEEDFEESLTKDNQKRGNDMNKVAEDFELNNLEKMGTNEYEANKNRDKHIKMYRKFANISDSEPITEETINEYALNKTATYCNREPDRIKAEILGQRYSEYEQE